MFASTRRCVIIGVLVVALAAGVAAWLFLGHRREPPIAGMEPSPAPVTSPAPVPEKASNASVAAPAEHPAASSDASPSQADSLGKATELMNAGEELISRNSQDSVGLSVEELEMGIARVREALLLGHPDRIRGYRLLADAHHSLLYRSNESGERKAEFRRAEGEAYRELAKVDPSEPRWLEGYAETAVEPEAQLQAWQAVVARFPERSGARYIVGELLCKRGDRAEGLQQLMAAARALPDGDSRGLGTEIMFATYRCGTEAQGMEVRAIVEAKEAKGSKAREEEAEEGGDEGGGEQPAPPDRASARVPPAAGPSPVPSSTGASSTVQSVPGNTERSVTGKSAVSPDGASAPSPAAQKLFEKGMNLIDDNSSDAAGAEREPLERGIIAMQEALRLGHPDQKGGLLALIRAHQMLASFGQDDATTAGKLKEIYVQLEKIEPGEPSWPREHAELVADTRERLRLLREAVQRFPRYLPLRLDLGVLLCDEGQAGAGSAEIVEAARLLPEAIDEEVANRILSYADECRDKQNLQLVTRILAEKTRKRP